MNATLAVAADLIREAISRRWFLVLGGAITFFLGALSLGLNLEVVDGALAATRFFGSVMSHDVQAADVVLRPIFKAASYVIFYGGIVFGILACSDFAPNLLAPGRIEHLLSLPVSRVSLLTGTLLGVWAVIGAASLYGAVGMTLILGVKTSVWSWSLVLTGLLASISFVSIYGVMLWSSVFVRSAAVSAMVGMSTFWMGIAAGYRDDLAPLFSDQGLTLSIFRAITELLPPLSAIADTAAAISEAAAIDPGILLRQLLGLVIYGGAFLMIGVWRFEAMDF